MSDGGVGVALTCLRSCYAFLMRFTGGCGEIGADEAAARVREYGGSCWGLDEALECERALNERFPLTGGRC